MMKSSPLGATSEPTKVPKSPTSLRAELLCDFDKSQRQHLKSKNHLNHHKSVLSELEILFQQMYSVQSLESEENYQSKLKAMFTQFSKVTAKKVLIDELPRKYTFDLLCFKIKVLSLFIEQTAKLFTESSGASQASLRCLAIKQIAGRFLETIKLAVNILQTKFERQIAAQMEQIQRNIMTFCSKYYQIISEIIEGLHIKKPNEITAYVQDFVNCMTSVPVLKIQDNPNSSEAKQNKLSKNKKSKGWFSKKDQSFKVKTNRSIQSTNLQKSQIFLELSKNFASESRDQSRSGPTQKTVQKRPFFGITNLIRGKTAEESYECGSFPSRILNEGQEKILSFYASQVIQQLSKYSQIKYEIVSKVIGLFISQENEFLSVTERESYFKGLETLVKQLAFGSDKKGLSLEKSQQNRLHVLSFLSNLRHLFSEECFASSESYSSSGYQRLVKFLAELYDHIITQYRKNIIDECNQSQSQQNDLNQISLPSKKTISSSFQATENSQKLNIHQVNYELSMILSKVFPLTHCNPKSYSEFNMVLTVHQIFLNQLNFCRMELNCKTYIEGLKQLKDAILGCILKTYKSMTEIKNLDSDPLSDSRKKLKQYEDFFLSYQNILIDSIEEVGTELNEIFVSFIDEYSQQWQENLESYSAITENCFIYIAQMIGIIFKHNYCSNGKIETIKNSVMTAIKLVRVLRKYQVQLIKNSIFEDGVEESEYPKGLRQYRSLMEQQTETFSKILVYMCIPRHQKHLDYRNLKSIEVVGQVLQLFSRSLLSKELKSCSSRQQSLQNIKPVVFNITLIVQKTELLLRTETEAVSHTNSQTKSKIVTDVINKFRTIFAIDNEVPCFQIEQLFNLSVDIIVENYSKLKEKLSDEDLIVESVTFGQEVFCMDIVSQQLNDLNRMLDVKGDDSQFYSAVRSVCFRMEKLLVVTELYTQIRKEKTAQQLCLSKSNPFFNEIVVKSKNIMSHALAFILKFQLKYCEQLSAEKDSELSSVLRNLVSISKPNLQFIFKILELLKCCRMIKGGHSVQQLIINYYCAIVQKYLQKIEKLKDYRIEAEIVQILKLIEEKLQLPNSSIEQLLQIKNVRTLLKSKQIPVPSQLNIDKQLLKKLIIDFDDRAISILRDEILSEVQEKIHDFNEKPNQRNRHLLTEIIEKICESGVIGSIFRKIAFSKIPQVSETAQIYNQKVFEEILNILCAFNALLIKSFDQAKANTVKNSLLCLETPSFHISTNNQREILLRNFQQEIFQTQTDNEAANETILEDNNDSLNSSSRASESQNKRNTDKSEREQIVSELEIQETLQQQIEGEVQIEDKVQAHQKTKSLTNQKIILQNIQETLPFLKKFYEKVYMKIIEYSQVASQNYSQKFTDRLCSQLNICIEILLKTVINKRLYQEFNWAASFFTVIQIFTALSNSPSGMTVLLNFYKKNLQKIVPIVEYFSNVNFTKYTPEKIQIYAENVQIFVTVTKLLLEIYSDNRQKLIESESARSDMTVELFNLTFKVSVLGCKVVSQNKIAALEEKISELTATWRKALPYLREQKRPILLSIASELSLDEYMILPDGKLLLNCIEVVKQIVFFSKASERSQTLNKNGDQNISGDNQALKPITEMCLSNPIELIRKEQYGKIQLLLRTQEYSTKSMLQNFQPTQHSLSSFYEALLLHLLMKSFYEKNASFSDNILANTLSGISRLQNQKLQQQLILSACEFINTCWKQRLLSHGSQNSGETASNERFDNLVLKVLGLVAEFLARRLELIEQRAKLKVQIENEILLKLDTIFSFLDSILKSVKETLQKSQNGSLILESNRRLFCEMYSRISHVIIEFIGVDGLSDVLRNILRENQSYIMKLTLRSFEKDSRKQIISEDSKLTSEGDPTENDICQQSLKQADGSLALVHKVKVEGIENYQSFRDI